MLIEDLIREYGLWAVFFGVMIEGDLTLLFAGVLAQHGLFTFGEALLVSTLGGFVGDSFSYLVGYRGKEWIKHRTFYQRAQPRLEKLCARFGLYSIFLVKYVYGLRTASAVFWGFAHMRLRRFLPLTLVSCGAWALVLIGLGYSFSGAIVVTIGRVQKVGVLLLVAFAIAIAIALTLYLIEIFVVGRRVPEMEPMEPTRIHEKLHEKLHETFHEAIDTVRKDSVKDPTEEDQTVIDRLPTENPRPGRSRQVGSHHI